MSVYVNNLTINQNTDFEQTFTLESGENLLINLTGYTFKAEMRKHPTSVGVTTFTTGIYGSPNNGQITIGLSTSQTASIKEGRYVYDIVMTNTEGKMSRVIEGMALVRPGATKF